MSYLDKNILPNEQIIYRTRKNWIIFSTPLFWTLISAFFYFNSYIIQIHEIAFIPAIAALLYWIKQLLLYYFSEFAVTNMRVLMREGFFIRRTNDTRLASLANVTVNQSLLGQVLNYGTVVINSFGGEKDPFNQINSPAQFQKKIQMALYQMQPNINTGRP